MPTTRTIYWRTDATAGGDGTYDSATYVVTPGDQAYDSANAASDAQAGDITAAGTDEIVHFICTQPGVDTTRLDIRTGSGWVVDATHYLIFECQGSARHNGVSRESSSTGYQLKPGTSACETDSVNYVRFKGIEFCNSTVSQNFRPTGTFSAATSDFQFDECLFTNTDATTSATGAITASSTATMSLTNCLFVMYNQYGPDLRNITATVDHCGIITGAVVGILAESGTTVTNTYAVESSSEDFWTSGTAPSGSHNASLDNSAATDYTNTVDIVASANEFTSPSTNPASADMTLLNNLLVGAGTGSESIDITGAARSGTADIGPFNFAGGTTDVNYGATGRGIMRGVARKVG